MVSNCIFQHYLTLIRRPEFVKAIRVSYIPRAPSKTDEPAPESVDDKFVIVADTGAVPSAYPIVQPMKAALYFDSVDGFGEWRILISTRADKNLREARKKTPEIFRIIIKKIKYGILF